MSRQTFEKVQKETTSQFEGLYVDDKFDPGKCTYAGVSFRSNPNWPGWKLIDKFKKENPNFTPKMINDRFKDDKEMKKMLHDLYYNNYFKPYDDARVKVKK